MLEQLFGSKSRAQFLRFLFSLHDESFDPKEASISTDLSFKIVEKEIASFLEIGLLKKRESADKGTKQEEEEYRDRYVLNRESVLFPELKALIFKAQILKTQDFTAGVLKLGTVRLFLLSGIFLKQRELTGTDVLLVGNVNRFKLKSVIRKYEREIGTEIYYTIFSEKEYEYRLSIADHFLYTILDNKNMVIVDKIGYDTLS